jgi:hypothetical protein
MLFFREYEVNGPADANMGTGATEVIQDGLLRAAGFFQCIGQHAEVGRVEFAAGKDSLVVRSLSGLGNLPDSPLV